LPEILFETVHLHMLHKMYLCAVRSANISGQTYGSKQVWGTW